MKQVLFSIVLLLSGAAIGYDKGQSVSYKVLYDDPENTPLMWVDVDWFWMDAGFSNIDGFATQIGASAYATLLPRIAVEGFARYGWLSFNDVTPLSAEAGVNFNLIDHVVRDNIRVVLSSETSTNYATGSQTTTTTFIEVPGNVRSAWGIRGGAFYKRGGWEEVESFDGGNYTKESPAMTLAGLYGGISHTTGTYLVTSVDNDDPWPTASNIRWYVDALLVPVATVSNDSIDKTLDPEVLGFRAGIWVRPNLTNTEFAKYKTNIFRDFFRRMSYGIDFGKRPLDGWYTSTGISYSLFRPGNPFHSSNPPPAPASATPVPEASSAGNEPATPTP